MKKYSIAAIVLLALALSGCSGWAPVEDRDVVVNEITTEVVTLPDGRVAECILWDHFGGSAGDEQLECFLLDGAEGIDQ